jgi:hypothetical protein
MRCRPHRVGTRSSGATGAPPFEEDIVSTRFIAIAALVIAVILLLIFLL